jgi:hypothetical protein
MNNNKTCGNCGHPYVSSTGIRWCNEEHVSKKYGSNVFVRCDGSCKVNPSQWKPEKTVELPLGFRPFF